jgi:hypothetical protein
MQPLGSWLGKDWKKNVTGYIRGVEFASVDWIHSGWLMYTLSVFGHQKMQGILCLSDY